MTELQNYQKINVIADSEYIQNMRVLKFRHNFDFVQDVPDELVPIWVLLFIIGVHVYLLYGHSHSSENSFVDNSKASFAQVVCEN